jgi:hypothetical protein
VEAYVLGHGVAGVDAFGQIFGPETEFRSRSREASA